MMLRLEVSWDQPRKRRFRRPNSGYVVVNLVYGDGDAFRDVVRSIDHCLQNGARDTTHAEFEEVSDTQGVRHL